MSFELSVEEYARHLLKLYKPWKGPAAYTREYTGNYYGEDLEYTRFYNWQEYEQQARNTVQYFLGDE